MEKKNLLKNLLILLAAGTLLAACDPKGGSSGGSVSEDDLSLRKGPVTNTVDQAAPVYTAKDPGENKSFGAAYFGAPPMIPHTIADQSVNMETNDCMDCHGDADENTPGIPASHRIKAKFASPSRASVDKGQITRFDGFIKVKEVAGNRFGCMLCHAPQAENVIKLVDNDFQPTTPEAKMKDVLDALNEEGTF